MNILKLAICTAVTVLLVKDCDHPQPLRQVSRIPPGATVTCDHADLVFDDLDVATGGALIMGHSCNVDVRGVLYLGGTIRREVTRP